MCTETSIDFISDLDHDRSIRAPLIMRKQLRCMSFEFDQAFAFSGKKKATTTIIFPLVVVSGCQGLMKVFNRVTEGGRTFLVTVI